MGLLATWATGPTNIEDLDEQLISAPIRHFLNSLPHRAKEYLGIPLKMSRQNEKLIINSKSCDYELGKLESAIENEKNEKFQCKIYNKISSSQPFESATKNDN